MTTGSFEVLPETAIGSADLAPALPLVSIVLPAYNEAGVLTENVATIFDYLQTLRDRYRFEVLLVNDGSRDSTGDVATALRATYPELQVIHHRRNMGLGVAFQTAFARSLGDYVITMDVDLSYAPDHIERLLDTMIRTGSVIVLASPYMPGGKLTAVPWQRRVLSVWGNRFLRLFARGKLSTLTSMVRAYDGPFVRSLVLRSAGMDIMPELIYKTMILRGGIEQIPAHLDWTLQLRAGAPRRTSSMRIIGHVWSTILSGFVFRPFMFLILPGLGVLMFSLYVQVWMLIHFYTALNGLPEVVEGGRNTAAFAIAFARMPHTFIVGLLSLLLAVLLIGLGILALQSKKYFEELMFLQMALKKVITSQQPR